MPTLRCLLMTPVLWLTLPAAVVDWSPGPVSPPHTALEGRPLVRVDTAGFIWIAGASNTLIRNPGYNTARRTDAFVARVSPAGEPIFTKTFEGFLPAGLALDRLGNAIIAGHGLVMKVTTGGQVAARLPIGALVEGVAVDDAGAIYLTGTADENFRATPGAAKPGIGPKGCHTRSEENALFCPDAFVAKLRPDLSAFVYATFLGGIRTERAAAIAVDGSGAAYVTGETWSADFPVTPNALQHTYGGGVNNGPLSYGDVFVTKVDPSGRSFLYSTFLGGRSAEWMGGVAVDNVGRLVVTGATQSEDFPVTANALQRSYGGGTPIPGAASDAFAVRFDERGAVMWSTYFGREERESAGAVMLGPANRVYAEIAGAIRPVLRNRPASVCEPSFGLLALDAATGTIVDYYAQWPASSFSFDLDGDGRAYVLPRTPSPAVFGPDAGSFRALFRVDFSRDAEVSPDCIVNAASMLGGGVGRPAAIAPGEIVSILGEKLGPGAGLSGFPDPSGRLPVELGGTRVSINGRRVAILSVSEGRIDAVVPFETAPGVPARIVVERSQAGSEQGVIDVSVVRPGLFTIPGTRGQAAALNEDGSLNSARNPARRGSVLTLYATGLGAMSPLPDSLAVTSAGLPLSRVVRPFDLYVAAPVSTLAAGLEITYAGPAPGMAPGVVQVNGRIPELSGQGAVPIKVVVPAPEFDVSQDGVFVYVQ
ncbi:MAG: hypothetical protein R2762_29955 [Bryobacteraceae bacterium]